jgi:acetyltransferase-like isoleucine patch superfamily enzyme
MSVLSESLREHWRNWSYGRRFDRRHQLRRSLGYHVVEHGFEIGDYSYGAPVIRLWGEGSKLKVGKYCSIGPKVEFILGGNHHLDRITTFPLSRLEEPAVHEAPASRGDITVGSDVWIGTKAVILSGVTVGDGAVIGAHTVVARDVAPYAVVVGNPAREVRKRFADNEIETLLALRWWDLPDDEVRGLRPMLQSNNVAALLAQAKRGDLAEKQI